jgi:hypothetical protein
MAAISAVPDMIHEEVDLLSTKGVKVEEIVLGTEELHDMWEWIDPHYKLSVEDAIYSKTPFYWEGVKITPSGKQHDFTLLV